MRAFVEAVGVTDPMVVLGHSFGGGVATKFAHDHPDRARYLVVVNSVGDPRVFVGNLLSRVVDVNPKHVLDPMIQLMLPELDRRDGAADPAHLRRQRHARSAWRWPTRHASR